MRTLASARGAVITVILSLGIALAVAVFAVVDNVLLRPLPHPHADRLVAIWSWNVPLGREHQVAPLDFFDFARQSTSFAHMAAYYPPGFTLTGDGNAERVPGARVSSGIFDVFGVRPMLGRGFAPAEDRRGAARVAVISHRLWARRFQSDRAIIGRSITLSGNAFTVIGVLPAGFDTPAMWPRMPDVWVPIGLDPNVDARDARMLRVLGRLRDGVTAVQADTDLRTVAARLASRYPETNRDTGVVVTPLQAQLTRDAQPSLVMLAVGVAALLLVAIGNAAGLILSGTLRRRRELWTRLALGASRRAVIVQVVRDHVGIALVSGVAAFALAYLTSGLLVDVATAAALPRAAEIVIDRTSLLIALALSLAGTLLSAAIAALAVTRRASEAGLIRDAGTTSRRHRRMQSAMLVVQTACSLALLAGAALLVRSFYELRGVDLGFDAAHAFTLRVSPPAARYPAGPVLAGFYDQVIDRVRAVPGVEHAAVVDWLPASGAGSSVGFRTEASDVRRLAEFRVVSDDYFHALDIPLLAGRGFDARDDETAPGVAIVNERFARAVFGTANVIGRHVTLDKGGTTDVQIVGVTRDVREISRRVAAEPGLYVSKRQRPWLATETRELIVGARNGLAAAADIQRAVRELEPDVPLGPVTSLAEATGQPTVRARMYASAIAIFAAIALLLAMSGIYGAVSLAVAERTRDLGIRVALGASPRDVTITAARHGLLPSLGGVLAGMPMALGAGQLVRQQLFDVQPADPITLVTVATGMLVLAALGSMAPTLRVARTGAARLLAER
jgi:putative ABC transport system permease protein